MEGLAFVSSGLFQLLGNQLMLQLRANVTKNQVKFEFRGRSRKIDFSLFTHMKSP